MSDPKTRPFSVEEKSLLLDLIEERRNIIENKVTNQVSNNDKAKAWTDVHAFFNSHESSTFRTLKQLKQYDLANF